MNKLPIQLSGDKILTFCKEYHITYMALFGSVLTPNFTKQSDIDILVKFDAGYIPTFFAIVDMESELSATVGRKVDLRTPNDLSPFFRDEVLATAKTLYAQ